MLAQRPRLFCELCCGSAAVTLRLLGGRKARPPVSYMGSKTGLASAILGAMGLYAGQGADAVFLCDAGPWARVWAVLSEPEGARQVAAIIRGWVGEDARALWARLRAEPEPADAGEAAAAWLYLTRGSFSGKDPAAGIGHPDGLPPSEHFGGVRPAADMLADWCARWLFLTARSPYGKGPDAGFKPEERDDSTWAQGSHAGTWDNPRPVLAASCERQPAWPPVGVLQADAATLDPAWVARWLVATAGMYGSGAAGGFKGLHIRRPNVDGFIPGRETIAARVGGLQLQPAAIARADAAALAPPDRLSEGTYVYIDPPYSNTTAYEHALPREQVLDLARRWADAGAIVAVSEAEPLPLPDWHAIELTKARRGQRRTFSRQQSEWLTLSRPAVLRHEEQVPLFGEAEA